MNEMVGPSSVGTRFTFLMSLLLPLAKLACFVKEGFFTFVLRCHRNNQHTKQLLPPSLSTATPYSAFGQSMKAFSLEVGFLSAHVGENDIRPNFQSIQRNELSFAGHNLKEPDHLS